MHSGMALGGWLQAGCRLRAEPLTIELCLIPLDSSFLPARIATSHRGFTLPRPKGCVGNVASRAGCLSPSYPYGDKGNCPPLPRPEAKGSMCQELLAMAEHRKEQRFLLHGEMQRQTPRAVLSPAPHCADGKPSVVSVPGGAGPSAPRLQRAESSSDEIPGAEGVHKDAAKRGPGHRTGRLMHLRDNTGQTCQIPTVIFMCCYRFSGRCSARCSILQPPAGRAQEPFYLMCINPCILPHFCPQMALIRSPIQHEAALGGHLHQRLHTLPGQDEGQGLCALAHQHQTIQVEGRGEQDDAGKHPSAKG